MHLKLQLVAEVQLILLIGDQKKRPLLIAVLAMAQLSLRIRKSKSTFNGTGKQKNLRYQTRNNPNL